MENEHKDTQETHNTSASATPEISTSVVPEMATTATIEIPAVTETTIKQQISGAVLRRNIYAFLLGIVLVFLAFLFSKGVFVAATVNGSPISRLAVVQALEKQGGEQALQAIITERVVKAALAKSDIAVDQDALNAKIAEIETQVKKQGGTLQEALLAEGMTMTQLTEQLGTQQQIEKILQDKLEVTDEEVATFITENKITPPAGMSADEFKATMTEKLKQQKFQTESQKWVADITESAKIKYYVTY